MVPDPPGRRFALYLGTGGPGHIDPHRNDGVAPGGSQGIHEDPAWEPSPSGSSTRSRPTSGPPSSRSATLRGPLPLVGRARPVLRGPRRGKSTGDPPERADRRGPAPPLVPRTSRASGRSRRPRCEWSRTGCSISVPGGSAFPRVSSPSAARRSGWGDLAGEAVTMLEFARDRGGVMPRMFAVNHHPEIVDRFRQMMLLDQKRERGRGERASGTTSASTPSRPAARRGPRPAAAPDLRLHLLGPLRFHLYRQIRERLAERGRRATVHEGQVLQAVTGEGVEPPGGRGLLIRRGRGR